MSAAKPGDSFEQGNESNGTGNIQPKAGEGPDDATGNSLPLLEAKQSESDPFGTPAAPSRSQQASHSPNQLSNGIPTNSTTAAEIAEVLWGMLTSPAPPQRAAVIKPASDALGVQPVDMPVESRIIKANKIPPNVRRGKWTAQEDQKLIDAVRTHQKNWKAIASCVGTRTPAQCLHRWKQSRDPSISRGKWTEEDDAKLVAAVEKCGRQWARIAAEIPGRTGAQCRERYCNKLDPTIYHGTWTAEMDAQLRAAVLQVLRLMHYM